MRLQHHTDLSEIRRSILHIEARLVVETFTSKLREFRLHLRCTYIGRFILNICGTDTVH
jgi:hypothetical protein